MHWKIKTFIFMLLIGALIAYPYFAIKYFETERAWRISGIYLSPLFFLFVCLVGPNWYYRVVKPLDETKHKSKSQEKTKDIVSIGMMILLGSGVFWCLMTSLIITTNSFYGRKIMVSEPVLNYVVEKPQRGKPMQYIDIQHPKTREKIHLQVYRPYGMGEYFEKEMKIGIWGMLYSKD